MIRTRLGAALLASLIPLSLSGLAIAADPASATGTQAEYQQLRDQWKKVLGETAATQIKRHESRAQFEELRPKYSELLKQAADLEPKLQAAAEKAFAEDEKQKEIDDLLFTMAIGHLRNDNYEEALRLSKFLLDHNTSQKDVARVAASAAFATMQLDEAKKLLDSLGGVQNAADPSAQRVLAGIERYRPMWEREQKFREAEAKADDLPRVKITTSKGDIVVELYENEAPNTVANFISLVDKGFYNGTLFHRVLPGFMAQTGDPRTKDLAKDPGQAPDGAPYTIACECYQPNHREHFRGTLSMAHKGRDTGSSQLFLTFAPTSHLDGQHTVFGRVIEGMDVLAKLQRFDPEAGHNMAAVPLDKIIKAEVIRKRDHPYEPKKLGQ